MGDPAPQGLGRYQLLRHLATSGRVEVLLARSQGTHGVAYHAVKRVRVEPPEELELARMRLDDASLAVRLRHPNLVQVHEIGAEADQVYVAMEFVHGEDLRRVLAAVHQASDQVPIALVTGIVAAAAAGLHHAHTLQGPNGQPLGIVHRGVSPSNILVGFDGSVRVSDFQLTRAALRIGEPATSAHKDPVAYLSPEQVTARPIDARSDVFALGVVLYELATARRLFKGEHRLLTMGAITHGEIPPPSQLRPDLPRPLDEIILKALAASPDDRFQSAELLREALDELTRSPGERVSQVGIADYLKQLFGVRLPPWLGSAAEPARVSQVDFDGDAPGVVAPPAWALRELALPAEARPPPGAPRDDARWDASGEPAGTMRPEVIDLETLRGESMTPLGWASEPARPGARRRIGALVALTLGSAVAAFVIVSRMAGPDLHATEPVLAPARPPAIATPDAPREGTHEGPHEAAPETAREGTHETAPGAEPAASSIAAGAKIDPGAEAAPGAKTAPAAAAAPAPATAPAAPSSGAARSSRPPPPPRAAAPERRPSPAAKKPATWDPDALFPK